MKIFIFIAVNYKVCISYSHSCHVKSCPSSPSNPGGYLEQQWPGFFTAHGNCSTCLVFQLLAPSGFHRQGTVTTQAWIVLSPILFSIQPQDNHNLQKKRFPLKPNSRHFGGSSENYQWSELKAALFHLKSIQKQTRCWTMWTRNRDSETLKLI